MKYLDVPHCPRPVSRLVLGTASLEEDRYDDLARLMDAFLDQGGNCIDLAHIYGGGGPQRAVGRYLRERGVRERVFLFDKGCHPYAQNRVTRDDLFSDLTENLERLRVDGEDFFVLHRDDPSVPVLDILLWLNEAKGRGLIQAFGVSNWSCERIEEAQRVAGESGLQPFSVSSVNLSLAKVNEPMWAGALTVSDEDRDWYRRTGMPLFSWSAGGGGYFAGVRSPDIVRVYENPVNQARLIRSRELAAAKGVSVPQIALAYTLCQPMNIAAIVGPRTVEELMECIEAIDIQLSPDELASLEA